MVCARGPAEPGQQDRPNGPDSGAPPTGGAGVFPTRRKFPRFLAGGAQSVRIEARRCGAPVHRAPRRAFQPERVFSESRSEDESLPDGRINRQRKPSELGRRSVAARRATFRRSRHGAPPGFPFPRGTNPDWGFPPLCAVGFSAPDGAARRRVEGLPASVRDQWGNRGMNRPRRAGPDSGHKLMKKTRTEGERLAATDEAAESTDKARNPGPARKECRGFHRRSTVEPWCGPQGSGSEIAVAIKPRVQSLPLGSGR